jgi:two-component system cell cycle response regulator CtrA
MGYLADLERKYILALEDVKSLTAEVQRLRGVVEELSNAPVIPAVLQSCFTKYEALLFGAMLEANGPKTQEYLLSVVYAERYGLDEPDIKIIDVFVCKLRKKLAPHGIKIETCWGRGYSLPLESKLVVRRMNEEAAEAVLAAVGKKASRRA